MARLRLDFSCASSARGKGVVLLILSFFVFATLLFPFLGWRMKHEIERRMKLKIGGEWVAGWFMPVSWLHHADFEWAGKVRVYSGEIRIDYSFFSLIAEDRLRLKITGKNLEAELLDTWAEEEGMRKLKIEHFFADLQLGRNGLEKLFRLEVESPTLEFHFASDESSQDGRPAQGKEFNEA